MSVTGINDQGHNVIDNCSFRDNATIWKLESSLPSMNSDGLSPKKSIHGPILSLESQSRAEPKPRPFTKLCSITYLSRLLCKQHTTSLAKLLMIKLSFKKWKMLIISIELKIVLSNDWTLFKHEFLGASRSYFFPPSSLPYPPWNFLIFHIIYTNYNIKMN